MTTFVSLRNAWRIQTEILLHRAFDRANRTCSRLPTRHRAGWVLLLASLTAGSRIAPAYCAPLTAPFVAGYERFYRAPDANPVAGGLLLLGELDCLSCHRSGSPDASSDFVNTKVAPRLDDVAERVNPAFLEAFLADPTHVHPGTTMPGLFAGLNAAQRAQSAEALTHFLVSLKPGRFQVRAPDAAAARRGERVFRESGCLACHAPQSKAEPRLAAQSVPLPPMDKKYSFAGLRSFLRDPLATRPSGRMPRFNLAGRELDDLVHYLIYREKAALELDYEGPGVSRGPIPSSRLTQSLDPTAAAPAFTVSPERAAEGQVLFESQGCAACHALAHRPERAVTAYRALKDLRLDRGCLDPGSKGNHPFYPLDARQRNSLTAAIRVLQSGAQARPSVQERIASLMTLLNCYACHERDGRGGVTETRNAFFSSNGEDAGDEGRLPPRLTGVGDKLRQDWLESVLSREASVRAYMNTRMPQFGEANLARLAEMLVEADRHPVPVPPVDDPETAAKEAGRKLVGSGGLSCILCHRFNRQPGATLQMIDLITATQRLNPDWFHQFLLDPNRFKPGTRMPQFWPGGQSVFPNLLDGDAHRQVSAIWTYLSDGRKAVPPEGLSRQLRELIVGGEAVVYRGKFREAGWRGIAVGYPEQVNLAFDAEQMRLAQLWKGRFLDVSPHWNIQGMGRIGPLGRDVLTFPHGPPLAVLDSETTPWPETAGREAGYQFRGYQLDERRRPTFLYNFQSVRIEDAAVGRESAAGQPQGLRRTLTFRVTKPETIRDWWFRVGTGETVASLGQGRYRIDNKWTVTLRTQPEGEPALVRRADKQQELVLPVPFQNGRSRLELEYEW
jgi:mono/diheme cytochrome c family protein